MRYPEKKLHRKVKLPPKLNKSCDESCFVNIGNGVLQPKDIFLGDDVCVHTDSF